MASSLNIALPRWPKYQNMAQSRTSAHTPTRTVPHRDSRGAATRTAAA
ncbi:hypothetical protein [Streptomyces sp. MBT84]|nr:hypothetical protein [Streptomyces sp. MBT84]